MWVILILALIPPRVVPARLHSSRCSEFVVDGLTIRTIGANDEIPLSALTLWISRYGLNMEACAAYVCLLCAVVYHLSKGA